MGSLGESGAKNGGLNNLTYVRITSGMGVPSGRNAWRTGLDTSSSVNVNTSHVLTKFRILLEAISRTTRQ